MSPINFPHKNLEGLDGCKRMGLDDNLAIALVLNTAKQDTTTFLMKKRTLQSLEAHTSFSNEKSGHYIFF
jgi:hypothetical protein